VTTANRIQQFVDEQVSRSPYHLTIQTISTSHRFQITKPFNLDLLGLSMIANNFMGCRASTPMNSPHTVASAATEDLLIPMKISQSLDTSLFITTGMLGVGGFGRVFAGTCLRNNHWYAIKEIKKVSRFCCFHLRNVHLLKTTVQSEVMKHRSGVAMIFGELNAMSKLNHPFIINLNFAFQDR
jgi:hypothetical protein